MELLTVTTPVPRPDEGPGAGLDLRAGRYIGDLGSGTGALPVFVREHCPGAQVLRIDEIDYVREALARARARLRGRVQTAAGLRRCATWSATWTGRDSIPLVPVEDGRLRPGRRVAAAELRAGSGRAPAGGPPPAAARRTPGALHPAPRRRHLAHLPATSSSELRFGRGAARPRARGRARRSKTDLREFLNEAARLLDLEERGIFHFWDADELVALLREAGFTDVETRASFGDPPQAIVASAVRT